MTINCIKNVTNGAAIWNRRLLFQGTVLVLAFGLGINYTQQGSILGPILAMVISFVPSFE